MRPPENPLGLCGDLGWWETLSCSSLYCSPSSVSHEGQGAKTCLWHPVLLLGSAAIPAHYFHPCDWVGRSGYPGPPDPMHMSWFCCSVVFLKFLVFFLPFFRVLLLSAVQIWAVISLSAPRFPSSKKNIFCPLYTFHVVRVSEGMQE